MSSEVIESFWVSLLLECRNMSPEGKGLEAKLASCPVAL